MIVSIGSRNASKIASITSAFSKYPELWQEEEKIEYIILSKETRQDKEETKKDMLSGVSHVPIDLEEIIQGARNRAKKAYEYGKMVKRHLPLWSRNRIGNVSHF